MKRSVFTLILSFFMAVLTAALPSLQIFAQDAQNAGEYISEVKIGVGKTAGEAEKSLDGYVILQKDGKNADLNAGAGGGIGSKGERVVYLGYKTTSERSEAITDLAVMNMKGGYSVKDYEVLMEQQMTQQIIPFVNGFLAAIEEYRENYTSEYPENKARAKYVHDALNKLTDDDCGGAGLGDLLLNETKYEMGDEAYEALSEADKKQHADILTIIAQSNGKATLIMENLITRAADTSEDTWIDRFVGTTYEDLLGLYPDMLPSDAANELAKEYDDDAKQILTMWSALGEQLDSYDENMARLKELKEEDLSKESKLIDDYDDAGATEEQAEEFVGAVARFTAVADEMTALFAEVATGAYISAIEYKDGTLFDFFNQDYKTVADDVTVLYPLVASLSAGQRAGLEFVTLSDLIMLSSTDTEGYKDAKTDALVESSIYENVDREIYKSGGVALTSEALRAHAAEEIAAETNKLSLLSDILLGVAGVSIIAFGVTIRNRLSLYNKYSDALDEVQRKINGLGQQANEARARGDEVAAGIYKNRKLNLKNVDKQKIIDNYNARSPFATKLMLGFGLVAVVLSSVALYFSYRDLVDYYNVEYSPIPKYIVDEKDITAYNNKGEKIVIKNQAAYYKVVETARAESDEWFEILGTSGDLNGTVGRQWLALYAARNENETPILASSLKVVVGSDNVPTDYTTGIHMFGSDAAYNLNNTQLVWNNDAKSTYVYFGVEDASGAATSGSSFSAGYFILAGVIGLLAGAAITIGVSFGLKKKKNAAAK